MFKVNKIDLLFRLICLITYSVVILFSKRIITLILLLTFLLLMIKKDIFIRYIFLCLIGLLCLIISLILHDYFLIKMSLIIFYIIYYFDFPITYSTYEENNIKEIMKGDKKESEYDYIRFKSLNKNKLLLKEDNNLYIVLYLTVHYTVLFLSILVG